MVESEQVVITHTSVEQAHALFAGHFTRIPEPYKYILERRPANLESNDNTYYFDKWHGYWGSYQTFVPLEEFRKYYKAGLVGNFVYYRAMGVVFITLCPADHCSFMATVYNLHKMNEGELPKNPKLGLDDWFEDAYQSQDQFLSEGLGMYQSSCGTKMYRHKNFNMSAREFAAFEGYPIEVYHW